MAETTPLTAQLSPQQTLYLSHDGSNTTITVVCSQVGQQQQSASQVKTGRWSAQPQLFKLSQGYVGILRGEQTQHTFYIQGTQVQVSSGMPNEAIAAELKTTASIPLHPTTNAPSSPQMDPMPRIEPMQPMSMGSMSMSPLSSSPMTMTMGEMSMSMGTSVDKTHPPQKPGEQKPDGQKTGEQKTDEQQTNTTAKTNNAKTKRFCSQCGESINAGDRFCAYCGHQLN